MVVSKNFVVHFGNKPELAKMRDLIKITLGDGSRQNSARGWGDNRDYHQQKHSSCYCDFRDSDRLKRFCGTHTNEAMTALETSVRCYRELRQLTLASNSGNLVGQGWSVCTNGLHHLLDGIHNNVGAVNDDEVRAILGHNLLAVF